MKFKYNFKVYAPATIANFAVNKNNFSIALQDLQDEIIVKKINDSRCINQPNHQQQN